MKTIKVIDLLNKIVNGEELPNEIRYFGKVYKYDYETKNYKYHLIGKYDWLFGEDITAMLNDEVEIIEDTPKEDKKIEELSTWYATNDKSTLDDIFKYLDYNNEQFYNKINELVRKVNGE